MSTHPDSIRELILRTVWHSLAAVAVFIVPMALQSLAREPLSASAAIAASAGALAYLVIIAVLRIAELFLGRLNLLAAIMVCCVVFASDAVIVLIAGVAVNPVFLVSQFISATALVAIYRSAGFARPAFYLAPLAVVTSVACVFVADDVWTRAPHLLRIDGTNTRYLSTVLYKVEARSINRAIPPIEVNAGDRARMPQKWWGGALTEFRDAYLLATGDGRIFQFSWVDENSDLNLIETKLRVPINLQEFVEASVPGVELRTFRVSDLKVVESDGLIKVYAVHHFWNSSTNCSVLRVSVIEGGSDVFDTPSGSSAWETLFESSPCLPFKDRAVKFGGLQNGGKMSFLGPDSILLTVGDHEFDGYYAERALPQDLDNTYGKSVQISLDDGDFKIFTIGHRNPGGLHIDRDGQIWSTEHGPKGGDELNLLVADSNYGWPLATYGTAYDKTTWPPSRNDFHHTGFERPVYAWLPSIGISNLTRVRGPEFSLWKKDLLIASLTDRALWRLRLVDDRVVYSERIRVDCRTRDILQTGTGRLILWCDNANRLIFLAEPQLDDNGELLFAQCEGCHSLDHREKARIGPDLRGIGGRRIASKRGFIYSAALQGLADERWTRDRLDAFIEAPQEFAPGNTMQFEGMSDARQRKAIVDFLLSVE